MLIWSAFINWITAIPWVSKSIRDKSSVAVIAATLIFSRIINVLAQDNSYIKMCLESFMTDIATLKGRKSSNG